MTTSTNTSAVTPENDCSLRCSERGLRFNARPILTPFSCRRWQRPVWRNDLFRPKVKRLLTLIVLLEGWTTFCFTFFRLKLGGCAEILSHPAFPSSPSAVREVEPGRCFRFRVARNRGGGYDVFVS